MQQPSEAGAEVVHRLLPEERWREHAALLIRTYMGSNDVDPELLDWIVRK